MNLIYAEHAWKVNREGEPLAKYFNESQWNATQPVRQLISGELVAFPNSGWVATQTPTAPENDIPDEPLEKVKPTIKKTTRKTTRKRKAK